MSRSIAQALVSSWTIRPTSCVYYTELPFKTRVRERASTLGQLARCRIGLSALNHSLSLGALPVGASRWPDRPRISPSKSLPAYCSGDLGSRGIGKSSGGGNLSACTTRPEASSSRSSRISAVSSASKAITPPVASARFPAVPEGHLRGLRLGRAHQAEELYAA